MFELYRQVVSFPAVQPVSIGSPLRSPQSAGFRKTIMQLFRNSHAKKESYPGAAKARRILRLFPRRVRAKADRTSETETAGEQGKLRAGQKKRLVFKCAATCWPVTRRKSQIEKDLSSDEPTKTQMALAEICLSVCGILPTFKTSYLQAMATDMD